MDMQRNSSGEEGRQGVKRLRWSADKRACRVVHVLAVYVGGKTPAKKKKKKGQNRIQIR
jgi:hypothetical protein